MSDDVPKRGELWWCEMPEIGLRPAVVLSRDQAIPRLRRALVAPCTRTIRGLASEVLLDPEEDPVPHPTAVSLDSVDGVSLGLFISRMGSLSFTRMDEICAALGAAVDCDC
jgi:mRNA interferase MazF